MITASNLTTQSTHDYHFDFQDVLSPENNKLLGKIELANDHKFIDKVMVDSRSAFGVWSQLALKERCDLLNTVAIKLYESREELADIVSVEIAKPRKSALDEVIRSCEYIQTTIEIAKSSLNGDNMRGDTVSGFKYNQKIGLVERVPLGIVLCISPFNYPINLAVSKIVPALLAGNTVVFKPATQGALSGFKLAEILFESLPQGVFQFVMGKGSEIGDYLTSHHEVDLVNFTGSTKVGFNIAKIANTEIKIKKLILELGGKDVAIITKNANLEKAVSEIMKGAFSYSGQRCTAVKKVFVQSNVYDQLMKSLKDELLKLTVGNSRDDVKITSLISTSAADWVEYLVKDSETAGGNLVNPWRREENTIYPNIIEYPNMKQNDYSKVMLYDEEQFGPILPIFKFDTVDDMISAVNSSKYGLQADVFTQDINEAFYISQKLNVGTVQINSKSDRGPDTFPFSGTKSSGFGVQGIEDSLLEMTRKKLTVVNL